MELSAGKMIKLVENCILKSNDKSVRELLEVLSMHTQNSELSQFLFEVANPQKSSQFPDVADDIFDFLDSEEDQETDEKPTLIQHSDLTKYTDDD